MLILFQDATNSSKDTAFPLAEWLLPLVVFLLVVGLLASVQRYLQRTELGGRSHRLRNQLILLGLTLFGAFVVFLVLPLDTTTRGQLLGFLGIVLSASLALSSTTFLGNAMAGLMLRAVRNFRVGDFLQTGDVFGRITELGLFHMEIQTEDRDLVTLPHMLLVTQSVKVLRDSGTVVSATVSLGYDVSRREIERNLIAAAEKTGLKEPFVQILELGDYSVTYRIAGLLVEVKKVLSCRSQLRGEMIDALHGAGIEIVSPTFMNQRVFPEQRRFLSRPVLTTETEMPRSSPESMFFDKAEEAESIENLRERLKGINEECAVLKKEVKEAPDDQKATKRTALDRLEVRAEWLGRLIQRRLEEASES